MLGGFRKTAIAGATLGLIAVGLSTGPTPVSAAPGDDKVCTVVTQNADVANIEAQHDSKQTSRGNWNDVHTGAIRPWFGLYYPVADPNVGHNTPAAENWGAVGSNPNTPVQVGDRFQWTLNGKCGNSGFDFNSKGDGRGFCGRSVGIGTGSVAGRPYIVRWESVGSQLILLDPTATGSVNAQANTPGSPNGSCTNGTATRFLVDGAIADRRA